MHYYSKQRMLLDPEARVSVLLPDINPLPSIIPTGELEGSEESVDLRLKPRTPLTDEEFLQALGLKAREELEEVDEAAKANILSERKGDQNNLKGSHNQLNLFGWGHDVKIRLIFLMLRDDLREGRRRNVDRILTALKSIEKEHFHMTITYFWIQMVTIAMASLNKGKGETGSSSSSSIWTYIGLASDQKSSSNAMNIENMDFDIFYRHPDVQKLRNSLLYEKYYGRTLIESESASLELVLPNLKQFPDVIS